ncbi:NUDIX hydrolase [Parafrankia sp. FMc2]|uniref:NUDIX hydrolase n=1 Tax=Parafrankia sp. FMc2 TaxID=3233196 RepID=UPI0034D66782
MSITNEAVGQALRSCLARHPGDHRRLAPLLRAADRAGAGSSRLTWRRTLPGHVTCSMVAVNVEGRVLQIHHRASGLWLQPGGHVEDRDLSLFGAALRELAEETGIGRRGVDPVVPYPVDVDIHWVGAHPHRREPQDHMHYDFRFVVTIRSDDLSAGSAAEGRPVPVSPTSPDPTTSVGGRSTASGGAGPARLRTGRVALGAGGPGGVPASRVEPAPRAGTGGTRSHQPGGAHDLLVLAADEVAGARWVEVADLDGRLAERVAAVLGRPGGPARP